MLRIFDWGQEYGLEYVSNLSNLLNLSNLSNLPNLSNLLNLPNLPNLSNLLNLPNLPTPSPSALFAYSSTDGGGVGCVPQRS